MAVPATAETAVRRACPSSIAAYSSSKLLHEGGGQEAQGPREKRREKSNARVILVRPRRSISDPLR